MNQTIDIGGVRILVIDSSVINRMVLREQFKIWNCSFEEASEGPEALKRLSAAAERDTPFQLVLLDNQIGGMSSEELARRIRGDSRIDKTPLILLTPAPGSGRDAGDGGALFDVCLTKPLKQSELHDSILSVLRGPSGESRSHDPLRVLVVDDSRVNLKLVSLMVEKSGYPCDMAGNGREALEAISKCDYGLVLMDCKMPEMDGFEATRQIRESEGGGEGDGAHLPVIAMTADSQAARADCMEAGMDDLMCKPFELKDLQRLLRQWMPGSPGEEASDPSPLRA